MSRKANEGKHDFFGKSRQAVFHLHQSPSLTPYARDNVDDEAERSSKRAKVDNRDIADKVRSFQAYLLTAANSPVSSPRQISSDV